MGLDPRCDRGGVTTTAPPAEATGATAGRTATEPVAVRPRIDPRLVVCLVAVYLIWSSTYLALRIAVTELPPLFMASIRQGRSRQRTAQAGG